MSVTIDDIAREANVSKSTVSRVMNGTKAVSPELFDRVSEVIKKNNFKPNELARGLVTSKTNSIGIILSDISNPVFGALTKGVNRYCQKKGYTVLVCESGGEKEKEIELLNKLEDKKIDGVLFAGVDVNDDLVQTMNQKPYPVVLVTNQAACEDDVITTVVHDNQNAVKQAIDFLIQYGHRKIGFISGPENDYSSGIKRMKGYKESLTEHGIEIRDSYIEYGKFTFESGFQCMKKIYEENSELPTAIMACSDLMAIGAMRYLNTVDVRIPDDISIMGFDDSELAMYSVPELSTVRISYFDEGEKAAKELFKRIDGKVSLNDVQTYYIGYKIIRRNSVKNI